MPVRHCLNSAFLKGLLVIIVSMAGPNEGAVAAKPSDQALSQVGASDLEARAENLLRRMTLEEKVGQLSQYSHGQPTGPLKLTIDTESMIAKGQVGAMLNVVDPKDINAFQRIALEKSRLKIPILFGLDVTHGFRTDFPISLGLAATWDPPLVERAARVAAMEAAAQGVRWTFSPMVDITRDPRWGRMAEGLGEDPYLGSRMAEAHVRGYQGARLNDPGSLAACAKHYVGYGAVEGGRDYNSTEVSEHTLREVYLPPFDAAVRTGVATLMSAFNSLNGVPASANGFTLRQILRKEWKFQGPVVSDWSSISELIAHGVALDEAGAALRAFLAGVDIDMGSDLYRSHLPRLVMNGQVPEARVDEAVRRVLRLKLALGLFERPLADEIAAAKALYRPESISLAQDAAERSVVLLKNAPGSDGQPLLPLARTVRKVAIIGPLGDDPAFPEGVPKDLHPRVPLPAALAERLPDGQVLRYRGVGVVGGTDAGIAEAVEGAKRADLAILALGEGQDMIGEAASRTYLGLPGRQQELLEAIVATGKPVILILFSGRPLTLPWAFEHVPAVIAGWFPGISGGPALARILVGETSPSGKLPVSWPRGVGQLPLYYNALSTGRPAEGYDLSRPPYDGDSKYLSRYIDEENGPQFPFGHGLSYTRFDYGNVVLSTRQLSAASLNRSLKKGLDASLALTAETTVTNTGSRSGEEVVQIYMQLRGASMAQPVRSLKGFQRVLLAPGETRTLRFELKPAAFAIWNEQNRFAAEPSHVRLWISPDSSKGTPVSAEILP